MMWTSRSMHQMSHEKKKKNSYFPFYWLFNTYHGWQKNPHITGVCHPPTWKTTQVAPDVVLQLATELQILGWECNPETTWQERWILWKLSLKNTQKETTMNSWESSNHDFSWWYSFWSGMTFRFPWKCSKVSVVVSKMFFHARSG